jgi:hypothetical protein
MPDSKPELVPEVFLARLERAEREVQQLQQLLTQVTGALGAPATEPKLKVVKEEVDDAR